MGDSIDSKQSLSCPCGSPLQLDVLSLNRKLFDDHSQKPYYLACMAGVSTATSEFVLNQELLLSAPSQKGYNPAHDDARIWQMCEGGLRHARDATEQMSNVKIRPPCLRFWGLPLL